MTFESYSRVILLTDRYQYEGIVAGDIGYIIEVYGDRNYEVEFSNREGITVAVVVVHEDEIELRELGDNSAGTIHHLPGLDLVAEHGAGINCSTQWMTAGSDTKSTSG